MRYQGEVVVEYLHEAFKELDKLQAVMSKLTAKAVLASTAASQVGDTHDGPD